MKSSLSALSSSTKPGVASSDVYSTAAAVAAAKIEKSRSLAEPKTSGSKWFNLPAPILTPELKQDLRLMNLRGYLDPKHFMKRVSRQRQKAPFPKYFQVGTVVNGPADFYSGRLAHAERAETFAETILKDQNQKNYLKRKFVEVQKNTSDSKRAKNKKNKRDPFYSKKKKK